MRINIPEDNISILERMQSKKKRVKSTFRKLMGKPFRRDQFETILAIMMAIEKGFENVILRAPTGSGKSAVAVTVARQFQPYFLLSQDLSLTEQYQKDYPFLEEIKGRNNFKCAIDAFTTAEDAPCTQKRFKCPKDTAAIEFVDAIGDNKNRIHNCGYWDTKYSCLQSHEVLTTPFYIFRETGKSKHSQFAQREFAIYDEAHDLPDKLSTIIEESWDWNSHKFLSGRGYSTPHFPQLSDIEDWSEYTPRMLKIARQVESDLKDLLPSKEYETENYHKISSELKQATNCVGKLKSIINLLKKEDYIYIDKKSKSFFAFKPVKPTPFAKGLMGRISKIRLFMSATILPDILIEELDLDPEKTMFISVNRSNFPVENRRVFCVNVSRMHKKNWEKGIIKQREFITTILDLPRFQKLNSLILAPSYKLCQIAVDELQPYLGDRILYYLNSKQREVVVEEFKKGGGKVLIGPSLWEGFDFKDDLCRLIFLLKTPVVNYGDKLVQLRIKVDENEYREEVGDTCGYVPPGPYKIDKCENFGCPRPCQRWSDGKVVLGIEQGLGRGVRSEDDWCFLFILDSNFGHFYGMKKDMFSEIFREGYIKIENKGIKKFLKNFE